MPEKCSVLVYGVDELASAVARTLLLSGHAVAMHADQPAVALRRRMAYADAWHDGVASLEEVEARRADQDSDLLIGLRSGMYIPLLTHPLAEVVGRWPWDVIADARRMPPGSRRRPRSDAELTIVLGPGAVAGLDCDLVIETGGQDPGAVLREGAAGGDAGPYARDACLAFAPRSGIFRACKVIGEVVTAGEVIAIVDTLPVLAPASGRLRGLQRSPRSVRDRDPVAEIVDGATAQVSGVHPFDQALARAVAFAIELEQHDLSAGLLAQAWTARR